MQWLDYECFICKAEKFQRYSPGTGGPLVDLKEESHTISFLF